MKKLKTTIGRRESQRRVKVIAINLKTLDQLEHKS